MKWETLTEKQNEYLEAVARFSMNARMEYAIGYHVDDEGTSYKAHWYPDELRELAEALIAAADYLDREREKLRSEQVTP